MNSLIQDIKGGYLSSLNFEGAALHCPFPLIIFDHKWDVQFVNIAFSSFFKYEGMEALGLNLMDLLMPGEIGDQDAFTERLLNSKDQTRHVVKVYRKKKGEHFQGKTTIYGLLDNKKEIEGIVMIIQAIEKTKQERPQLERINKELKYFAHSASHDLKEPIRNINTYTHLLLRYSAEKLDDQCREYLQFIAEQTKRMGNLVHGILAYAEASDQKATFRLSPIEKIISLVRENLDTMIRERHAKIELACETDYVYGNPSALVRLFQNLILNSIKYTPLERHPRIKVLCKDDDPQLLISISDNGQGIAPQDLEKVFEPFRRNIDGYGQNNNGNGLGLATCKKIVTAHGGKIWADSKWAHGTTMNIQLPKAP